MKYKVSGYVRDSELGVVLNNGWYLVQMFRNSPGSDGQETTTVVQTDDLGFHDPVLEAALGQKGEVPFSITFADN